MNKPVKLTDRHCALCGKDIPGKRVKRHRCPHCLRRAYCSYDCRIKDWASKKGEPPSETNRQGQGHSDWCTLLPGEQDLDWIVAPSSKNHQNNGLGLFAKGHIPTMTRICVEGHLNKNGIPASTSQSRIQMANHDCNPNASIYYSTLFSVAVLYSKRDIQPGEEICVTYVPYGDPFAPRIEDPLHPGRFLESFADYRTVLKNMGVVCPTHCFCYRKETDDLIRAGRNGFELLKMMVDAGVCTMIRSRRDADQWLNMISSFLQIDREIGGCCWMQKAKLMEIGFLFANFQRRTLPLADKLSEAWMKIISSICHPEEEHTKHSLCCCAQNQVRLATYLALEDEPEEENPGFGEKDVGSLLKLIQI